MSKLKHSKEDVYYFLKLLMSMRIQVISFQYIIIYVSFLSKNYLLYYQQHKASGMQQTTSYEEQISELLKNNIQLYLQIQGGDQNCYISSSFCKLVSTLTEKCQFQQGYSESLINLALLPSSSPERANLKQFCLILIEKVVNAPEMKKSQGFKQKIITKFVYEDYQIQSIKKFKLIRKILCRSLQAKKFDFQKANNFFTSKLTSKLNIIQTLCIIESISYSFKYEFQLNITFQNFLHNSFHRIILLLAQNLKQNVLITYLCCRCLSHFCQFQQPQKKFGEFYSQKHTHWLNSILEILKSKWFIPNVNEKYHSHETIESAYLHTKKYATRGVMLFSKRLIFTFKKPKKDSEIVSQLMPLLPEILSQIIQELQYDCYTEKVRIEQVKLLSLMNRNQPSWIDLENRQKLKPVIAKLIALSPNDQENIIKNPYQSWFKNSDCFLYSNIRSIATKCWIQIGFPSLGNKKYQQGKWHQLQKQSLQEIVLTLDDKNLVFCQIALNILSNLDYDQLGKYASEVVKITKKVFQLCSVDAILIRNSSFRALSKITSSSILDAIEDSDFLKLAEICYEHLTKDAALLVRINAGICLLKLGLKNKCIQQFKTVIYESIVVLLKLIQEIAIQEIGSLINKILTNEEYSESLLPLSKEILMYACNCLTSFVKQLDKKDKQSNQDQKADTLLLFEQCSNMILVLLPKLSANELKPEGQVTSKLFGTISPVLLHFIGKSASVELFDINQAILRIIIAYLKAANEFDSAHSHLIIDYVGLVCTGQEFDIQFPQKIQAVVTVSKLIQRIQYPSQIVKMVQQVIDAEYNFQEQTERSSIYILKAFSLINLTSNKSIAHLCELECQNLMGEILNKHIVDKIKVDQGSHTIKQFPKNKKNQLGFGFMVSCALVCHYQQFLQCLSKRSLKQDWILQVLNFYYEHLNKQSKQKSQLISNVIYKFYVMGGCQFLQRALTLPYFSFVGNQLMQGNAPGIEHLTILKLSSFRQFVDNFICLATKKIQSSKVEILNEAYDEEMYQQQEMNESSGEMEEDEVCYLQSHNISKYYNRLEYVNEFAELQSVITFFIANRTDLISTWGAEMMNKLQQILGEVKEMKLKIGGIEEDILNLMKTKGMD